MDISFCADKGADIASWIGTAINAVAVVVTGTIAIWGIIDGRSARKAARIEAHHVAWIGIRQTLALLRLAVTSVQSMDPKATLNTGWVARVLAPAVASANQVLGKQIGDAKLFNLASNVQILATAVETDLADRVASGAPVSIHDYLDRIAPFVGSLKGLEAEHLAVFDMLGLPKQG